MKRTHKRKRSRISKDDAVHIAVNQMESYTLGKNRGTFSPVPASIIKNRLGWTISFRAKEAEHENGNPILPLHWVVTDDGDCMIIGSFGLERTLCHLEGRDF